MQTDLLLLCYWSGGRTVCLVSAAVCGVPAPALGLDHSSGDVVFCSTLSAGRLWTPLLLGHNLLLVVPQLLAYQSYQELERVRGASSQSCS